MDRREAIDILVGVIATNSEEENEALDLAIEALQDPTRDDLGDCNRCRYVISSKCDECINGSRWARDDAESETTTDLISRAKAIEAVRRATVWKRSLGRGDVLDILYSITSADQVTCKLKNPCNSLTKDDSDECKEQKSKLDLISRADAIEAWDKLSKRGRTEFDQVLMTLPSAETHEIRTETHGVCSDCISRQQAIEALTGWKAKPLDENIVKTLESIESIPPVTPNPTKGWMDLCELMGECMDDDVDEGWQYDGDSRPANCPLVEVKGGDTE